MPMSPLHPKSNPEVRRPVASTRVPTVLLALSLGSAVLDSLSAQSAQSPSDTLIFERQEVMIPVRDGVRLQTVIYQPKGHPEPLPILLHRTPYGVGEEDRGQLQYGYTELARDGYVFAFQNVR